MSRRAENAAGIFTGDCACTQQEKRKLRRNPTCRGFKSFCPCQWNNPHKPLILLGLWGFSNFASITTHGLHNHILMLNLGINFPSGGIGLQPFRLLHHQ